MNIFKILYKKNLTNNFATNFSWTNQEDHYQVLDRH